jgi:hypothetical protein
MPLRLCWATLFSFVAIAFAITIPSSAPSNAAKVDPATLGVSLEFFAFPGYTELSNTVQCLANIEALRGTPPPVRIGGTTQYALLY